MKGRSGVVAAKVSARKKRGKYSKRMIIRESDTETNRIASQLSKHANSMYYYRVQGVERKGCSMRDGMEDGRGGEGRGVC